MIYTFSAFIYGHKVDVSNNYLDFDEGSGELSAILNIGEYSLTDFCTEVSRALNAAGTLNYSVSVDRSTAIITITADGSFEILNATGTHIGTSIYPLLGFNPTDTGSATSHTGALRSGFIWEPQMKAQEFVDFDDQQSAVDGIVKKSASGKVESVSFGLQKIMDANFMMITNDYQPPGHFIKYDSNGYVNAKAFMVYATTKADLEFIPDVDDPDVFYKCLLESTPQSADGQGFKLRELYDRGFNGYYETGLLKFRLID